MKKAIGYILVAVSAFAAGTVAGWVARKKTSEVEFEVTDMTQISEKVMQHPMNKEELEKVIDSSFSLTPEQKESIKNDLIYDEPNIEVVNVDTQKEQYFKRWKAEEAVARYDTRTKEEPEDPVVSEDLEEGFDPEFLEEAGKETYDANRPEVEAGSIEDWHHWLSIQDGEYDCVEVYWFEGDNVLTDEDGDPLENPGKYMGFDVATMFRDTDEDTTGDPDIRVVYNHKYKTVYQIIRRPGSYARKTGMEEFGGDYDGDDNV